MPSGVLSAQRSSVLLRVSNFLMWSDDSGGWDPNLRDGSQYGCLLLTLCFVAFQA